MWRVAIKGILAHKIRIVLTSISVVLGVSFMTGTLVLSDTIGRTFDNLITDVNGGLSAQIRAKSAFKDEQGQEQRKRIDASLVDTVRKVPGVKDAEISVQGFAVIVGRNGKGLNASGNGPPPLAFAWNASSTLSPVHLIAGKPPTAADDVVIDKHSAGTTHYRVGDRLRIVTVSSTGTSAIYRLSGIARFGSADSPAGATLTFFRPDVAERLLATPGKVDAIQIAAEPGVSQQELVRNIKAILRGRSGIEVVTGDSVVQEQQNNFHDQFKFFTVFLLVFAYVALLVGSFVIYNTFSITVAQRTRENALLRAVGASRRQITMSVFLEALTTGVIASVVGLALGVLSASGLKALLGVLNIDIPAGGTVVKMSTIRTSLIVGILVTVVASLIPVFKAARVPPIAAMREVALDRTNAGIKRIVAGAIVTLLGLLSLLNGLFGGGNNAGAAVGLGALLIFVGVTILSPLFARPAARFIGSPLPRAVGITGQLARENAMRNPKRTAATAAALMIGVGLVGFVTIFAASAKASVDHIIDTSFRADYIVNTSGFGSTLPPQIETDLAKVPGVKISTGLKVGSVKIGTSVHQIEGIDPTVIDQLFEVGVTSGSLQDLGDDGIAVYKNTAKSKHLVLGSKIAVQFANTGTKNLTVRAIYKEQALAGLYVISLATYRANFDNLTDALIMVKAEPGQADKVRASVERILKRYPQGKLQDQAQFKADQAKQFGQIVNLIYALLLMAIIIAVFGIAITLALSIFERTREIGLLRAVGMSSGQVWVTVEWEAVIIALFGTLLGLLIAVFFGWALVQALNDQGITRFSVPPLRLFVIVVIGACFGMLAALYPGWRASRMNVLEAIATE
jgi:putative ABC transport system permease protein